MNPPVRLLLCAVYFHSLLALVNHVHPGWLSELHHEVVRLGDLRQEQGRLEVRMSDLNAWREAKRDVMVDVVAERLTLRAAAERFQELNHSYADNSWWNDFQRRHTGASETDQHCREVIAMTESMLIDQAPDEAHALTTRLEAEMDESPDAASAFGLD